MVKRKLKELNLLDDFLFGSMVTYPGIGEEFSRKLLKIIFQKEFGKMTVVPQKVYYGNDTDLHGTRLDVYLEEVETEELMETASVYDVEPDNNDAQAVEALPKRTRFYHAKIDAQSLKSGESYKTLKNVIIIMIMSYDPFGEDRMIYTIQNRCLEEPELPYDDGAKTLYLYTKGKKGNPREELRQLLHYMEDTEWENAVNEDLQDIQKMVDTVKKNKGVSLEHMKIQEQYEMYMTRGLKEGREQGIAQERVNTERERLRAVAAEKEAQDAKSEAQDAKKDLQKALKVLQDLQEEVRKLKEQNEKKEENDKDDKNNNENKDGKE